MAEPDGPMTVEWANATQQAFFEAGPWPACASGGFGCVTRETCVDTPDGHRPVGDLYDRGQPFVVQAWDGQRLVYTRAHAPFRKPGLSPCYRITMSDGCWVECSAQHRFWTDGGWQHLSTLLAASAPALPVSSSAVVPCVHVEDDRHSSERAEDWMGRYCEGRHQCDGRLHVVRESVRSWLHTRVGVRQRIQTWWRTDDSAGNASNSDLVSSILGAAAQSQVLRVVPSDDVWPIQTVGDIARGRTQTHPALWRRGGNASSYRPASAEPEQRSAMSVGRPWCYSSSQIVSVEAIGHRVVYDFEVPVYHNYTTAGLLSHNSAKTWVGCLKAIWLCDEFPGNRGVIARKVGRELRATTMATFRKICPPSAYDRGGWNLNDGQLRLNNGSEIIWLHLEDQEHIDIVRGLEINFFLLDQAEEIDEGTFDLLMARLGRWDQATVRQETIDLWETGYQTKWPWYSQQGKPLPPVYPMLTCNPDTELHWIYQRFHPDSPAWQTKWKTLRYQMFFFSTRENRFLSDQNKQELLNKDAAFIRRYVDGLWGIPEGTIHVVPPESLIRIEDPMQADAFLSWIRATCRLHRTLDHGDAAPTCCVWWAVTQAGDVLGFREYYQPDKLVSYHRDQISALSAGETYESAYADPSIFHKAQQKHGGRWCTADEYADRVHSDPRTAIQWWPGDNNELGTRNRINEYLRVDPSRTHPWTKAKGAPRLFFVVQTPAYPQGIANVLTETRSQKRLSLGTLGGEQRWTDERDPDVADHGYDNVRYFLASRAPVGTEPVKRASRRSFLGYQALLRQQKRHKRAGLVP